MTWLNKTDSGQVIKENGKCFIRHQWRYCPFWVARFTNRSLPNQAQAIKKYRCTLFNKDKDGMNALPECNAKYGLTHKPKL